MLSLFEGLNLSPTGKFPKGKLPLMCNRYLQKSFSTCKGYGIYIEKAIETVSGARNSLRESVIPVPYH
jgi:hypothetical protein